MKTGIKNGPIYMLSLISLKLISITADRGTPHNQLPVMKWGQPITALQMHHMAVLTFHLNNLTLCQ